MDLESARKKFIEIFGTDQGLRVFHAPGRVNLIGEYTDFNGGYVFPCALDFGIYAIASKRTDEIVKLASTDLDTRAEVMLSDIKYRKEDDWANYPKGVIQQLQQSGCRLGGMNILLSGNIPIGAGLSSSAAGEVLTAVVCNEMFDLGIGMIELVKLSQRAENYFVGVMCGIMDQFAAGMGKAGFGMMLNCQTLDYEYVPLNLRGYRIVIANTNKQRGLADSKYNERRRECEEALCDLKQKTNAMNLCSIEPVLFDSICGCIKNPLNLKRARHVVYENARVKEAVAALRGGDIHGFGLLLNKSHQSLKDDFEVTGFELDALANAAQSHQGCIGSRMTGAGFGGCTVSIVCEEEVEDFIRHTGEVYKKATGLAAEFYIAKPGDGARELCGKSQDQSRDNRKNQGQSKDCKKSQERIEEEQDSVLQRLVESLLCYGLKKQLIFDEDVPVVRNQLLAHFKLAEPWSEKAGEAESGENHGTERQVEHVGEILRPMIEISFAKGLMPDDTQTIKEIEEAKIMGFLTPRQSETARAFREHYEVSPVKATEYFYALSRDTNYIRLDKTSKNIYWKSNTKIGALEITINLSKPEKDPREIAAAQKAPQGNYPKCLLCVENAGYEGRLNHPARQNHRIVPIELIGEPWYFQYSPYLYYEEHCIILFEKHVPMKITDKTFARLIEFVEKFPHYFIGSNADLPIVGGSILSHDHFQGGRHRFPMQDAKKTAVFRHEDFKHTTVSMIDWPLSTVRLESAHRGELAEMAAYVTYRWKKYTNEKAHIHAFTVENGLEIPHNTVTPIARKNDGGLFEMDIVLRNNITTAQHPLGLFHPHEEVHHVKKENIGLIEVMGLAILPPRLLDRYDVSDESARQEIADTMAEGLTHCGVFKQDEEGQRHFYSFMTGSGFILRS